MFESVTKEVKEAKALNAVPIREDREFDVSISLACWILTCPLIHYGFCPYKSILTLDQEEVTKVDVGLCTNAKSKRPYGELGSVEKSTCCGFQCVNSSFGEICPGCGCERVLVDDIVQELKMRQRERGDTAQIRRTEETLMRLEMLEGKIDLILDHLKIQTNQMNRN